MIFLSSFWLVYWSWHICWLLCCSYMKILGNRYIQSIYYGSQQLQYIVLGIHELDMLFFRLKLWPYSHCLLVEDNCLLDIGKVVLLLGCCSCGQYTLTLTEKCSTVQTSYDHKLAQVINIKKLNDLCNLYV